MEFEETLKAWCAEVPRLRRVSINIADGHPVICMLYDLRDKVNPLVASGQGKSIMESVNRALESAEGKK